MSAEAQLANTSITQLDPTLTKDVLYTRLVQILDQNQIDEIGMLPFLPDPDQCQGIGDVSYIQYPFIVQEQGTKLGVPVFCWVPVLDAAYEVFKDAVRNSSVLTYEWWHDAERREKVIKSSACLMIFCPDSFMAVNARKRLVQEGYLSAEKEIQFLDAILTFPRNCKSSGAWHHRKWLLCFMHKNHKTVPLDPLIIEGQLKICHDAAVRYPKCYYAWTMRHWLVEQLGVYWWKASLLGHGIFPISEQQQQDNNKSKNESSNNYFYSPLEKEFERMKDHTQRNVSDYSGLQHLQQCMVQLSGQWIVQRKIQDLMMNNEVTLQWTREELACRRQKRAASSRRYIERTEDPKKESGKPAERDVNSEVCSRSCTSSIKGHVQEISSPFSTVSEEHDRKGEPQLSSRASYPWVVHLWVSELERVREMVQTYPGHESLWYHLRFLYYGVRWLDSETDLLYCCTSSNGNDEQRTDTENEDNEEGWFVSLTTEQSFVEDLLSKLKGSGQQGQDSSLSLETDLQMQQKALASKYLSWVERLDIGRHQG